MEGLDCFGCDDPAYIGFDYMSLLKGAGGMLQGFGGDKQGQPTPQQIQAQMEAQRAAQSAANMKMILIGLFAILGLGGLAFVIGRK